MTFSLSDGDGAHDDGDEGGEGANDDNDIEGGGEAAALEAAVRRVVELDRLRDAQAMIYAIMKSRKLSRQGNCIASVSRLTIQQGLWCSVVGSDCVKGRPYRRLVSPLLRGPK